MLIPAGAILLLFAQTSDNPFPTDPRIVVDLVAREPEIVHPITMTFDSRGRLLVIESHTHFRPEGYHGPPHDRVRFLEDSDGDGRLDRWGTFFEGTKHTMDIALHPSGAIYLATRNEIRRLFDLDGDGHADRSERLVFLDTPGNYPHNGLSGLCFDRDGNLYFGMGENLGEPYTLIGSDGQTWTGGGEGGNVFWCTADGRKLKRIATGFWNPFGVERDVFDRVFVVDNDPDSSPPCRLLELLPGGDYGYQYRYGRSGRHPFQAWNGELPGTLPMVAGTGEGPCEVVFYDAPGLPEEYRGKLLVTAWADHQVQVFDVLPKGGGHVATGKPLVRGPLNFRPVGLAVAPDGSLYVSDWVLRDYELHGKGAIWHIRLKRGRTEATGAKPLAAPDRRVRERAARRAPSDSLLQFSQHRDELVRATSLAELMRRGDAPEELLRRLAVRDPSIPVRAMAVRGLVALGASIEEFLSPDMPGVIRREAIAGLRGDEHLSVLKKAFMSDDPYLRHAARQQFARNPALLRQWTPETAKERIQHLLVYRQLDPRDRSGRLTQYLEDSDPEVRFLAVKWISDEKLTAYERVVERLLERPDLTVQMYIACATALARLRNEPFDERAIQARLIELAARAEAPARQRVLALRAIPSDHPKLTRSFFEALLRSELPSIRLEAVQSLRIWNNPDRFPLLREVVLPPSTPPELRAEAIVGLATAQGRFKNDLLRLATDPSRSEEVRFEAIRSLTGATLSQLDREKLKEIGGAELLKEAADRVLGNWSPGNRPPRTAIEEWEAWLEGPFSPARGQRLFYNAAVGACFRCHRWNGRGANIGPDLTRIAQAGRRHIIEALVQPAAAVAPAYQPWLIALASGQVRTGLLVRTHLDEYTFVDETGTPFVVRVNDVEAMRLTSGSIMPEDISDRLLDQELRDLVGWLSHGEKGPGRAAAE